MTSRGCARLNIQELESRLQKEDPALAKFGRPLHVGGDFLVDFVEKHPLAQVVGNSEERADSMKEEIIALAPAAYKRLKEKIALEVSSRAGRQKTDVDEISPLMDRNDLLQLNKEIQDLKATTSAQNAALEAKDAEITSLKEALNAAKQAARAGASVTLFKQGVADRVEFPQNGICRQF